MPSWPSVSARRVLPWGRAPRRAGSPFACLCQGNVMADSCCLWAMETPSVARGQGIYRASYGAKPAPLYQGGFAADPMGGTAPCCNVSPGCCQPGAHFLSPLCVAVRSVKNKPAFFADKLYKSMKVQMGSPGAELREGAMLGRHPLGLSDLTSRQ